MEVMGELGAILDLEVMEDMGAITHLVDMEGLATGAIQKTGTFLNYC